MVCISVHRALLQGLGISAEAMSDQLDQDAWVRLKYTCMCATVIVSVRVLQGKGGGGGGGGERERKRVSERE